MTTPSLNRRRFLVTTASGLTAFTWCSPVLVATSDPGFATSDPVTSTSDPGFATSDPARRATSDPEATSDPVTSTSDPARQAAPIPKRPPALAGELVREFVTKAHADLAGTKALLAEHPTLLNATWDWGGGDFEAAIGGAGHMGNREIAEFLISQGARFDIFVAAMLGKLDIVRAALTTWPDLVHSKGPHGIPLLRHAKAGGEPAAAVVEFLVSKGAV